MQNLDIPHNPVMMDARHQMDSCTSLPQGPRETSPSRAGPERYRNNVLPLHVIDTGAEERVDAHVLYPRWDFCWNSVGDSGFDRRQIRKQCSFPHELCYLDRSFDYRFY